MAKVVIPSNAFYHTWENCIRDWYNGNSMGIWADPNNILLLNDSLSKCLSSEYVPEPWWGNHDIDVPLHSVVINYNPGQGDSLQHRNIIPYRSSYANDIVDSGYLPKTANWHFVRRAKPILSSLVRVGALPNYKPSLSNHLSVELMPWHTENIGAKCGFTNYFKNNIRNIYEYSICFAAHESKRIANDKLRNVVLLRLSGNRTKEMLKLLDGIGYHSVVKGINVVPGTTSYSMEYSIKRMSDVRFISIWGSRLRNNFPKGCDLDYILKNFI